jgi:hypothetical protein
MRRVTLGAVATVVSLLLLEGAAYAVTVEGVSADYSWSRYTSYVDPRGAYNIDQTIRPLNNPSASVGQATPAYFYSHQFGFNNLGSGADGGYIGIQTDSSGKHAIFSVWSAIASRCGPVPGTQCGPFSGEGSGQRTFIPNYRWVAGHDYRTRVWILSSDPTGTWWEGNITDVTTGVETVVGDIEVPPGWGWLSNYSGDFVEWYGPQPASCSRYPLANVRFLPPTLNAGAATADVGSNHGYAPPYDCPSRAVMEPGLVSHFRVGWGA